MVDNPDVLTIPDNTKLPGVDNAAAEPAPAAPAAAPVDAGTDPAAPAADAVDPSAEAQPAPLESQADFEARVDKYGTVGQYNSDTEANSVKARMAGATWTQINAEIGSKIQQATAAGATPDQINKELGFAGDYTVLDTFAKVRATQVIEDMKAKGPLTVDGFWQNFFHGFVEKSMFGQGMNHITGYTPPDTQPANNWQSRLGSGLGSQLDLAAAAPAAGIAKVGQVAADVAGVTEFTLDDFGRRAVADFHEKGGGSAADITSRLLQVAGATAKDVPEVAAMYAVSGPIGGYLASKGVGAVGQVLLTDTAALTAMAEVHGYMNGGVLDWQNILDSTIQMAVLRGGEQGVKFGPSVFAQTKAAIIANYSSRGVMPKDMLTLYQNHYNKSVAMQNALAPGDIGEAALLPKVLRPTTPNFFPKVTAKTVAVVARNLADATHRLATSDEATNTEMRARIDNAGPTMFAKPETGGYQTVDAKILHHIDEGRLDQLSPSEKADYETNVKPVMDEAVNNRPIVAQYAKKGSADDIATNDPNFVHRVAIDKDNEIGRAAAPKPKQTFGEKLKAEIGGIFDTRGQDTTPFSLRFNKAARLSSGLPSEKPTVYHVLEDQNGISDNKVVSDFPKGDAVYEHQNGKRSKEGYYGGFGKTVEDKFVEGAHIPESITVERFKVPQVVKGEWTDTKITKEGDVEKPARDTPDKEIPEHLVPYHQLQDGGEFKGRDGNVWNVRRATQKEVSDATGTRYLESAMGSAMLNVAQQRKIINMGEAMTHLKEALTESGLGHEVDNENMIAPEGFAGKSGHTGQYREVNLPGGMGKWMVHPDLADVLDDFAAGGPKFKNTPAFIRGINKISLNFMFYSGLGNIVHTKNLLGTAFNGRGFDNLTKGLPLWSWQHGAEAWQEVWNNGPKWMEAMHNGASMQASAIGKNSLTQHILDGVVKSVSEDSVFSNRAALKLGLPSAKSLGGLIQTGMAKELFHTGDILYMQRYLELRRGGMSPKDAVAETEKFVSPNMRASSKVMGSRNLAKVMGDNNVMWFGHWIQNKVGLLANQAASFADGIQNRDPAAIAEATGRFMATGITSFILPVLLGAAAKSMTGNSSASFKPGGTAQPVIDATELIKHPDMEHFRTLVSQTYEPAAGTIEMVEQITGLDFFHGSWIVPGGASPQQWLAERANHMFANTFHPSDYNPQKWIEQAAGIHDPKAFAAALESGTIKLTKRQKEQLIWARKNDPALERKILGY